MAEYVLEMKNIEKAFPGVKALDGVSLQIRPGEVHALMGENGAGKSTLMKILLGIYSADKGEILLGGKPYTAKNPKEAMDAGISMIHQELNPILDMPVYENIFIGRELGRFGQVDKDAEIREAQKLLDELKIHVHPQTLLRDLSVAQQQLIEIIKAISINARVVVMDEPTSAITDHEFEILLTHINRLRDQGVAIIYISHRMEEIFQICDRITVLRDGTYIGTDDSGNLDNDELIKMMVGREIKDVFPKAKAEIGGVVFEASGISRGNLVSDVSFKVRKGEILGIAGLVGAGRSELVEGLFGAEKITSGQVMIHGERIRGHAPKHIIKKGVALVTEDRKGSGLNLKGSVAENIVTVATDKISKYGLVSRSKIRQAADRYIDRLKIKTPNREQIVGALSGGNQQKVVLAKWLLNDPDIIILDEPTRGIDVGAKRDIYLLIGELVQAGKSVIMISSEIPELMGVCDRIMVMAEGRVTGELAREQFSQEKILTYASAFDV